MKSRYLIDGKIAKSRWVDMISVFMRYWWETMLAKDWIASRNKLLIKLIIWVLRINKMKINKTEIRLLINTLKAKI